MKDFIIEDDLDKLLEAEIVTVSFRICRCRRCKFYAILEINNNEEYIKEKEKVGGKDFFRCYYCEFINVVNTKEDINKYPKASVSYDGKIKYFDYKHDYHINNYLFCFMYKLFTYDIDRDDYAGNLE